MYAGPGSQNGIEQVVMVQDRNQTFEQFLRIHQQLQGNGNGNNNNNNNPDVLINPFDVMKRWVGLVEEAALTNQRLSILHYIVLGRRLSMVRENWKLLKGSPAAGQHNLHTEDDFFAFLSVKFTQDYRRKLMQVALMADVFPNVALISCCGIGEILKHKTDFLKLVKTSPTEATFWRKDVHGSMHWERRTLLVDVQDAAATKRRKMTTVVESAPEEPFRDWQTRTQTLVGTLIAEDKAAEKQADEAAKKQAEEVDKMMDAMNGL